MTYEEKIEVIKDFVTAQETIVTLQARTHIKNGMRMRAEQLGPGFVEKLAALDAALDEIFTDDTITNAMFRCHDQLAPTRNGMIESYAKFGRESLEFEISILRYSSELPSVLNTMLEVLQQKLSEHPEVRRVFGL